MSAAVVAVLLLLLLMGADEFAEFIRASCLAATAATAYLWTHKVHRCI